VGGGSYSRVVLLHARQIRHDRVIRRARRGDSFARAMRPRSTAIRAARHNTNTLDRVPL